MIKWLKCIFIGHEWICKCVCIKKYYDGRPTANNFLIDEIRTIILRQCQKCGRIKEKILKGDYRK